jgi:hypothetical protein
MNRIVDTFQWLSIARTATVNLDAERPDPESTSPPNFSSADDSIADVCRIGDVDHADDPEFDRASSGSNSHVNTMAGGRPASDSARSGATYGLLLSAPERR